MKTLLLLRHGKSDWDDAGLDDFDRPLAPRGIKALPVMARVLDALPEVPGRIYASPARRALETARGVARKMKNPSPIEEHPPLYLAEIPVFMELTRSLPEELETVMYVAHNPGMEEFTDWLCCGADRGAASLRTANLAWLELDVREWTETASSCATLRALIPSRLMQSLF